MLRLSKKTDYALISLSYVASRGNHPASAREIAELHDIPVELLAKVLQRLVQRGVLRSQQGIHGGYLLARAPAEIYLGQIVRMFDGPLAPVPCASQTAYVRCADCRNEAECGVHLAMKQVRDATSRVLDGTRVADLRRQMAAAGPGQAVVL